MKQFLSVTAKGAADALNRNCLRMSQGVCFDNDIHAVEVRPFTALNSAMCCRSHPIRTFVTFEFSTVRVRANNRLLLRRLGMSDNYDLDISPDHGLYLLSTGDFAPFSDLLTAVHVLVPPPSSRISDEGNYLRTALNLSYRLGIPVYTYTDARSYADRALGEAETRLNLKSLEPHEPPHYGRHTIGMNIDHLHSYRVLLDASVKQNVKEMLQSPVSDVRLLANKLRKIGMREHLLQDLGEGVEKCMALCDFHETRSGEYGEGRTVVGTHQKAEASRLKRLCESLDLNPVDVPRYIVGQMFNSLGHEV